MKADKKLVLDANILVRAVLGTRVSQLLNDYEDSVSFFTPELCFEEARRSVVTISAQRELDLETLLAALDQLALMVEVTEAELYQVHGVAARERVSARDVSDWPILATALLLNCPIWTEDRDFFGSGVATWTTANVEVYLRGR